MDYLFFWPNFRVFVADEAGYDYLCVCVHACTKVKQWDVPDKCVIGVPESVFVYVCLSNKLLNKYMTKYKKSTRDQIPQGATVGRESELSALILFFFSLE